MELGNSYQNLFAEINNFTVSYYDVGESSVPIIFLHGFPFDKSMWNEQVDALKATNRVIALNIRGFGKSTDEKSILDIALFANDLILYMDHLNINKAIICGLSMGGFIALNALKRFPERFEALILCDTQCVADTAEIKANRYKAIEQINNEGTTDFNEKFIKNIFHPSSLIDKKEVVENVRKIVFANSKQIITAGITALAERSETCSNLDNIRIPTLIICGREDEVTPLEQSEFMHQNIEGSILNIIENAGHVSNLEHPNEFNKHLINFLNSTDFT